MGADPVRDLLGVAHDGGLVERRLLPEREQVLAPPAVELVLVGGHAAGVGDEIGLGLEEPAGSRMFSRASREVSATWMILLMQISAAASVPWVARPTPGTSSPDLGCTPSGRPWSRESDDLTGSPTR